MAVELRNFAEGDVQQSLNLWIDRMSWGYQSRRLLVNVSQEVDGYVGSVAKRDGSFIGFAAGYVGTFGETLAVPYTRVSATVSLAPLQKVGCLAIVCVEQTYENREVGTKLVSSLVTKLSTREVPITAEVWRRDVVDGARIVSKLGFDHAVTLDDYWEDMTGSYEPCPECGQTPCECPGSLFVRQLSEGKQNQT